MNIVTVEPYEVFEAVADPIRIRILKLLSELNEETCLCEFSECLNEPDYKLSRHLKILRQAGLLSAIKDGRWVYHKLVTGSPHLSHLRMMLLSFSKTVSPFKEDLSRFKKQKRILAGKRCKKGQTVPSPRPIVKKSNFKLSAKTT